MLHGRFDWLAQRDAHVRIGRYLYHTFDYAILRSDFFEDLLSCALVQRGWAHDLERHALTRQVESNGTTMQWSSHLEGICDGPDALCARNMSLKWQLQLRNGSTLALADESHAEDARMVYAESSPSRCDRRMQICGCQGYRMSRMIQTWLWPPAG